MTAVTYASKHAVGAPVGWAQFKAMWRGSADEVRADRLVTASVGFVGAVMGVAVALFASGTNVAVCMGLVTLCVTPGCGLVCWLSTRDRLTRVLTVMAASLTWTVLVTSVLAWLQVTVLGVLLMATAGVGGVGSAIFLAGQLARYMKRSPVVSPVDEREDPSQWRAFGADPSPRFSAASLRSLAPEFFLMMVLVAATGLLTIAVIEARGRALGKYGLLPILGVSFLVAVILTIGVLVLALRIIDIAWPAASIALGLLVVELNGTPMWLASTPLETGPISTSASSIIWSMEVPCGTHSISISNGPGSLLPRQRWSALAGGDLWRTQTGRNCSSKCSTRW